MKKTLIAFSTIGLLLSGATAGTAFADGVEPELTEEAETEEELDLVNLTLDTVIQLALEDDSNLLLLSYQLDLLGSQERIAKNDLDDIEDLFKDRSQPFQMRLQYQDTRDNLLDAIEQIPYQERMTVINQDSTKEAISSAMTSSYVQLLSLQEQIELTKQSIQWLGDDLRVLDLQEQIGTVSRTEISDKQREITNLKRNLEDAQLTFDRALLRLLVNLNIPYSEDITLADIEEIEVALPEKPEDYHELIENSYQVQTAKENVALAELTLEQQWYNGLSTRKQNQLNVDKAKIELEDLETTLYNQMNQLYDDAESQYLAYQDALRELSYLEEDQRRLNVQYEVGLVSKYEYEQMERAFKQAETDLKLKELEYFTTLEKIEALQRGYIQ